MFSNVSRIIRRMWLVAFILLNYRKYPEFQLIFMCRYLRVVPHRDANFAKFNSNLNIRLSVKVDFTSLCLSGCFLLVEIKFQTLNVLKCYFNSIFLVLWLVKWQSQARYHTRGCVTVLVCVKRVYVWHSDNEENHVCENAGNLFLS